MEAFDREELIRMREFNTGVYAFKSAPLQNHITHITTDNVQGEVYVTDLIKIFNDNGLAVRSSRVSNNSLVEGFNVKSVLKKMEDELPGDDVRADQGHNHAGRRRGLLHRRGDPPADT